MWRLFSEGRALNRLAILIFAAMIFSIDSAADNGADIYKTKCAACHGKHGDADTMIAKNLKLRPLHSPEVQNQSDDELFNLISKGKEKMPAFDRKLSKDQIHQLVVQIRNLKR